jgi:hypothetical protein
MGEGLKIFLYNLNCKGFKTLRSNRKKERTK